MKNFDYAAAYDGGHTWLIPRTIFLVRHGSHAYGLDTPESDLDVKGVTVPPKEFFFGFTQKFEQFTSPDGSDPDMVVYNIRKFFTLASDCNPNLIEVLWADESDYLVMTELGRMVVSARADFLAKVAKHRFSGYAMSQLKKINRHYAWLKNPPLAPPTRAEFNLPERTLIPADQLSAARAAVQKQLDKWEWKDLDDFEESTKIRVKEIFFDRLLEITQWSEDVVEDKMWGVASRSIGLSDNFIELLDRERRYGARQKEWTQFQEWKEGRNPKRAALEAKFGYDTKHGMHLVRLMRMCGEILRDKVVVVKRPDREYLLGIRNGSMSYHELIDWARGQEKALKAAFDASTLPGFCDLKRLDELCVRVSEMMM